MSNFRFKALEISLSRAYDKKPVNNQKISDYFGEMTFGIHTMQQFLSEEAFEAVSNAPAKGNHAAHSGDEAAS